jgi:menaquinone-dependent protoporphyrinogen IX oxidase
MEELVLVTYASKYGATEEIAERIGENIKYRDWEAIEAWAKDIADVLKKEEAL